jgi:glycosyltransferase involved in cell wall biosynthesis
LSCGEGFSFIPREALALGIPVIITDNTASSTICKSGFVRSVRSEKKIRSKSNVYRILFADDCGDQFDCEVEDAKNALLDVYSNYPVYVHKALDGRNWVRQYDCENPNLRSQYLTLVKPKKVVLGNENKIEDDTLITNSIELYQKYIELIK